MNALSPLPLERDIRSKVVRFAKERGWSVQRHASADDPDCVFSKQGEGVISIEFKRPGEKLRAAQKHRHEALYREGNKVHVIDSINAGKALFLPGKETFRPYQHKLIENILQTPKLAVWAGMGTGKTVVALTAIQKLLENMDVARVLIVAPLRVAKETWPLEPNKWAHLIGTDIAKAYGPKKQREKGLAEETPITVINFDNIPALVAQFGSKNWPWDMVVIDEASKLGNPSGKQFRALKSAAHRFDRVLELTGTPASKSYLQLWSQMYLLDTGEALGKTQTLYKSRYFISDYMGYNWTLKEGAEQTIQERIAHLVTRVENPDLGLEEPFHNPIKVKFPSKLRAQYDQLEKVFLLEINKEKKLSAQSAADKSNKLSQFVNGSIYSGVGESLRIETIHSLKLDALEEVIEKASGHPVLVAYPYKFDRLAIWERFPHAITLGEDPDAVERWNTGDVDLLLVHPKTASHGLNLQFGGSQIVWFGLPWSLEDYQQLNKRLDRPGQKDQVIIHEIVVTDTIEDDKRRVLQGRAKTQEALLEGIKQRIRTRQL